MCGIFLILSEASGGGFNPLDPHHWGNAFWTWVIFIVALPFMIKFVFGPIAKALNDREEKARLNVEEAQKAKEEAIKAKEKIEEELQKIKSQEQEMLSQARAKAEAFQKEQEEKAKKEAERILERATQAIEQEKRKALSEIRKEVVDITIKAAEKIVRKNVDTETNRAFVEELIKGTSGEKEA